MAERRMFTEKIVESDDFLEMPFSTRCLYYDLNLNADDDGFLNSPNKIIRLCGASKNDLKILIAKRFILDFGNNIIVIKHWGMHNSIRKDRYKPTQYQEQLALLTIKNDGAYTERKPIGNQVTTNCQPSDNQTVTNGCRRLGEDRIIEDNLVEDNLIECVEENPPPPPPQKPTRHKHGMYSNVLLTDDDYEKLQKEFPHDYSERIDRLSEYLESTGKKYKNHLATIRAWARKDKPQAPARKSNSNPFLDMLKEESEFDG